MSTCDLPRQLLFLNFQIRMNEIRLQEKLLPAVVLHKKIIQCSRKRTFCYGLYSKLNNKWKYRELGHTANRK